MQGDIELTIEDTTDMEASESEIVQTFCFNTSFVENNFMRSVFELENSDDE